MIFSKPSTLALACCLAAVSISAAAGPTNAAFTAAVNTQERLMPNIDGACGQLPLSGISVGSGTVSHLGAVSVVATDCIVPIDNQFAFQNGKLTFTAANGDILRAEYSGAFVPQSGNVYAINGGTFRITGGTGRFKNATGGGELRGTEALSSDPLQPSLGQLQAIGTISY